MTLPDELFGQRKLAGREIQQRHLINQMVAQVTRGRRDRLEIFLFLVLLALATGLEAVEEDLFPVDLVLGLRLLGFVSRRLSFGCLLILFLFRLDHLQERIRLQLLLQVLLEVEQGHVQQIHRLIQARIDLELLPDLRALTQSSFHCSFWQLRTMISARTG